MPRTAIADALKGDVRNLVEERKARLDAGLEIETRSKSESRSFTDEEAAEAAQLLDEIEKIDATIETRKRDSNFSTRFEAAKAKAVTTGFNIPEQRSDDVANPGQMEHPEMHRYSLMRAINLRAAGKQLDGLEAEVSQEIETRSGKPAQGFYLPWSLGVGPNVRSNQRYEKRADLDTTTGTGAVATVTSPNLIDILTNEMRVAQAGATFLRDMRGNFNIPKKTARGTAYWVAESTAITAESSHTIGQVAFAPSTVGAYTDYSRKFLLQSSVDAESFVRTDLAQVLALELDRTGLNGSGTGAEPEGIMQNGSIGSVAVGTNGGAPTWAHFVDLETQVTQSNGHGDTMAYITNAKVLGKTKQVEKATNTAQFIHDGTGINGYAALRSNQVPSNLSKGTGTNLSAAIFGDFSDLIYAMWGGVDVLIDPYTGGTAGTVRVIFLQDADVQLRHTEAFSACLDIDTT